MKLHKFIRLQKLILIFTRFLHCNKEILLHICCIGNVIFHERQQYYLLSNICKLATRKNNDYPRWGPKCPNVTIFCYDTKIFVFNTF